MADGNAHPNKTKVVKTRSPRKDKSLALQAEYWSKKIIKLETKLQDARAKIPKKVLEAMELLKSLEEA